MKTELLIFSLRQITSVKQLVEQKYLSNRTMFKIDWRERTSNKNFILCKFCHISLIISNPFFNLLLALSIINIQKMAMWNVLIWYISWIIHKAKNWEIEQNNSQHLAILSWSPVLNLVKVHIRLKLCICLFKITLNWTSGIRKSRWKWPLLGQIYIVLCK